MADSTSNSTSINKILYWLIGAQMLILVALGGFLLDLLRRHDAQLQTMIVQIAIVEERMANLTLTIARREEGFSP